MSSERSSAGWLEALRALPEPSRGAALATLLRAAAAATLGYSDPEQVPMDQSLFELGMDSLRAVDLGMKLQQQLRLDHPVQFFDCADVRSLTARLLSRLPLDSSCQQAPAVSSDAPTGAPGDSALTMQAEPGERELVDFSRLVWPERGEAVIVPRWRWMFVESAARVGRAPRVWLYRDDGRLVAHHGAIPVCLQVGGEMLDAAWFADTMVLERHRASATGARLLMASNDAFPVGLSLGQTEQMRQIALRLGWVQVAPLQTYVLILRPARVLRGRVPRLVAGAAGVAVTLKQDLRRRLAGPVDRRLSVRLVDRFDERHDRLWESVRQEYGCAVTRDASYLNWKYVSQPGQDFVRMEFERDGRIVAIAVLLFNDPDGAVYGYRRAFVVDLVAGLSDSRLVLSVLDAIRQRCLEDADTIVFHLINDTLEAIVQAYGFTRRDPARYLLAHPHQVSAEARRRLLSARHWFVTMGDSDIDRPFGRGALVVDSSVAGAAVG